MPPPLGSHPESLRQAGPWETTSRVKSWAPGAGREAGLIGDLTCHLGLGRQVLGAWSEKVIPSCAPTFCSGKPPCGCCNKVPQAGWLQATAMSSHTSTPGPEARSLQGPAPSGGLRASGSTPLPLRWPLTFPGLRPRHSHLCLCGHRALCPSRPRDGATWVTSPSQDPSFSHIYTVFAPKGIVTGFRGLDLSSLGFLLLRAMMCVSSGPLPASLLEEAPTGAPVQSSGEPTPGRSSHALARLQRRGQSAGRHVGRAETCPMPTPDPGAHLAAQPGRQFVSICPRRAGLWRSPRVLPENWPARRLCVLKCDPKYSFNTVWETFFFMCSKGLYHHFYCTKIYMRFLKKIILSCKFL